MRINHVTGDTVWTKYRTIPNTGAECLCVSPAGRLYAWEGSITTPKRIIAMDAGTGNTLFTSDPLPGDGDQEIPFTVAYNTVYALRDGGNLHALMDIDTGFAELWSHPYSGPGGTYTQIGVGPDRSVYIPQGRRIYRLNHITGAVMDSSEEVVGTGTINARFAIGADGAVYIGNGASVPSEGMYHAMTSNLQTIWSVSAPYNYYSGPALGTNGILLFCGGGTDITAYQAPTVVRQVKTALPTEVTLLQNYPSPFNSGTKIGFRVQGPEFVMLRVFDVLGNEVALLVSGEVSEGHHEVQWNATSFASGVYYCSLTTTGRVQTKKLLLLK
jgi:hypothetical protein